MAVVNYGGGLRAFSIYDTTDGTTYQIDGADISPESTISADKILRDSSKGGTSSIATTWTLEILFADDSLFSSLDSADSQNRVWNAVAAGLNGRNLQWYENSTFVVDETVLTDPTSTDFPYRLRMSHTSVTPSIYANVNLLAYLGWEDADSDGLADGYTSSIAGTTFVADVQSATSSAASQGIESSSLTFPISGVEITSSIKSNLANGTTLFVSQNYAGTTLIDTTTNLSNAIVSDSITTLSNTYKFRFFILRSTSGSQDFEVKYPALTTNGILTTSSEFIDY